jgi:hypothetical protein
MSALTRKDCEAQLPPGTDPLVAAMHVAATSGERAASRRDAVTTAVTAWLGADSPPALIAAALTAELGGVGGRMGIGVEGSVRTERMRWATACGKGRRFATDGAAWDSAMEDALAGLRATDVTPEWVIKLSERCDSSDIAWPLALCLRRAYMFRDTAPVASGWADAARQIATQCEPDTDAGRLARRYELPTRRLMLTAHIPVMYRDYDETSHELTEGAAGYLIEELVEAMTGSPWEMPGIVWQGGEWPLGDEYDTKLGVTHSQGLKCFDVTIRTRRPLHPACMQAVRTAWVQRAPADTALEAAIIAAHETLSGTHPDALPRIRAEWDAEFGK